MNDEEKPPFQFGLWTLLLGVAAACAVLGLLATVKIQPRQTLPPNVGQFSPVVQWDQAGNVTELSGFRRTDPMFDPVLDDTFLARLRLERLSNLKRLGLTNTVITDRGLIELKKLGQLESLDLSTTWVTGTGLVHLQGLEHLRELSLNGTKITDDSLSHLAAFTGLTYLALCDTEITDKGIVNLGELTDLEELWLLHTKVTEAGVESLRSQLPHTKIIVESEDEKDQP